MNSTQKSTRPRAAAAAIALLSIAAASASLPAHANAGKTPYQIKGQASGLCLELINRDAARPVYHLQPCNAGTASQKFYLLEQAEDQEIIPQTMNVGSSARIVDAQAYDVDAQNWAWHWLWADRSWGSQAFLERYGSQGTWKLERAEPYTKYTKNQVLIKNGVINNWCLSTAYHQTTPGTQVVIGECNTPLDVWELVTTTFPLETVRP